MSQIPSAARPYWHGTTVYQIYPRSFCDSNGDGIGDLPGILDKLGYLADLGVETLWLCPFFVSPQRDFGYDIADHYNVAREYGTLDDCRRLLDAAHQRGMRVVLDMVMNHTSDEHPWFKESRSSRSSPRRDFYIWRPGRRPGGLAPPNNWRSLIGPRGWQYDAATDEWYFASFLSFQPDLNYRNPAVQEAMLDVVRHWLGQGFDGLRLDIFNCLFKDGAFPDNPPSLRPLPSEDNPDGFFQAFAHTVNHRDTFTFARTLRGVVDEVSRADGRSRFLVGEVFGPPALLRRYCRSDRATGDSDGLHLVFLFKSLRTPFGARPFYDLIAELEREFPAPLLPTYVFGNHDRPRSGERLGDSVPRQRLRATLQLTVRGMPFIYYGEELGMHNLDLSLRTALDPLAHRYAFIPDPVARFLRRRGVLLNRDECRGPMEWTSGANAGFTAAGVTPWLPIHAHARAGNVEAQTADPDSLLSTYRRLLQLRAADPVLRFGALALHAEELTRQGLLGYRRTLDGRSLDVFLNFSDRTQPIDLPSGVGTADRLPRLLFSTHPDARVTRRFGHLLRPCEAIVVEPS